MIHHRWMFARERTLTFTELKVWNVLIGHANPQGFSHPTISTVVTESGVDDRQVRRALTRMEERGFIARRTTPGKNTVYQVITPDTPDKTPDSTPDNSASPRTNQQGDPGQIRSSTPDSADESDIETTWKSHPTGKANRKGKEETLSSVRIEERNVEEKEASPGPGVSPPSSKQGEATGGDPDGGGESEPRIEPGQPQVLALALVPPETDTVTAAFDLWREKTGHTGARLDPKRRAVLTAALREWGWEKVKLAITGISLSDFHMGREGGRDGRPPTAYNDVRNVFKSAEVTERFIGLALTADSPRPMSGGKLVPLWDQVMSDAKLAYHEFQAHCWAAYDGKRLTLEPYAPPASLFEGEPVRCLGRASFEGVPVVFFDQHVPDSQPPRLDGARVLIAMRAVQVAAGLFAQLAVLKKYGETFPAAIEIGKQYVTETRQDFFAECHKQAEALLPPPSQDGIIWDAPSEPIAQTGGGK